MAHLTTRYLVHGRRVGSPIPSFGRLPFRLAADKAKDTGQTLIRTMHRIGIELQNSKLWINPEITKP